jgi:hypothetical protein
MKKTLLILGLVGTAASGFSQGSIIFNNRVVAANLDARIYDVEPGNPTVSKTGNPAAGVPAGSQTYGGAQIAGTGFTAALYGGELGAAEASLLPLLASGTNATANFTTAGRIAQPSGLDPAVQNQATPGSAARISLRVWNNMGGTVANWATVMANPTIPHGSFSFDSQPLGFGLVGSPAMNGLLSFNLFVVPEPSLIALGALGLGALLLRRRKA